MRNRLVFLLACLLLCNPRLNGQTKCIKMMEVMMRPCSNLTQQQTREYIELFNFSYTDTVDVEGLWYRTDVNNNVNNPTLVQDSIVCWSCRYAAAPFDLVAGPLILNTTQIPPRTLAIILTPAWNNSNLVQDDIPDNTIILTGAQFTYWGHNTGQGAVPNGLLYNTGDLVVLTDGNPVNSASPRLDSIAWGMGTAPTCDRTLQRDDDCIWRWHSSLPQANLGNHPRDADNSLLNFMTLGTHNYAFQDTFHTGGDTICPGDSTEFFFQPGTCFDSLRWDFGDPASGPLNTSTANTAAHIYNAPGVYPITLLIYNPCAPDTLRDTVLVTPPAQPNLGNDTLLCDEDSLVLNTGIGGAIYNWSTGAQTPTITVDSAGTYWVEVTTACVGSDTIVITTAIPPPLDLGPDSNYCNGGPVPLDAGPGFATYNWSTGAQTQTINATNTGTYSVLATGPMGCQTEDTITIGISAPPLLSISGNNVTCAGSNNGDATVVANGLAPLSYSWNTLPVQNTPTATSLTAGNYTVTVADSLGCTDSISIAITEPSPLSLTLTGTDETCNGFANGTAAVQVTGATPPYSYAWNGGQTTSSLFNLATGTYTVTVTDANGCQASQSIVIGVAPPPTVTTFGNPAFCEGEGGDTLFSSATGGQSPYYFTWWCDSLVANCGLDSINDDDPIANPTQSNWYYVQVIDVNGCPSNVDSIYITVHPKPIVDAGPDIFLCGDSAACQVLNPTITNASGPFEYLWLPGRGLNDSTILNPCARPDTTTVYALVATDLTTGCSSELNTTDTVSTIVVHVNPVPIAEAGPDHDICFGDSTVLQGYGTGAGPNYTFQWTPFTGLSDSTIASPFAAPHITTTYSLVTWSNGCPSYADTVQVRVHTLPTVEAGWDREICLGETTQLDALAWGDTTATNTYLWTPSAGILSDSTDEDPLVSPASTTTYYVQATSSWGCPSLIDSATVYLKPTPIAEAGDNPTICEGDSIVLAGGYYYTTTDSAPVSQIYFSWWPAAQMNDSTLPQPTVWPTTSTWYYLGVNHNTCTTIDSVLVTVNPEVEADAWADTTVICRWDSVQLHATGGLGGATFNWTPPQGLSNPGIANPLAAPDSTTTYTLIVEEGGCDDTVMVTIEVLPTPMAAYNSSLPQGCVPHEVHFTNTSADGIFHIWDFGDGSPITNEHHPVHTFTAPGTYTVTLTALGSGACDDAISSLQVTVLDTAQADFSSDPDFPVEMKLPNSRVSFTDQSIGAVHWFWDFGDGLTSTETHPAHAYQSPGEYFVTLVINSIEGCLSRVTHGPYIVLTPELFIPNVFSPNDDGINDIFLPEYSGDQPYLLQVYDRWGVLLHDSKNKVTGWRGTDMKGEAVADGVYYYLIRVGDREFAGDVTLLR